MEIPIDGRADGLITSILSVVRSAAKAVIENN